MCRESLAPPVQVKEPYGDLDMVTCRLSSCNPECTKYIPADNACEVIRQYIEINRYILDNDYISAVVCLHSKYFYGCFIPLGPPIF